MVQLRLLIDRSGMLLEYRLSGSSGSRLLDDAALALIERAAPYPAMPVDGPDRIEMSVPIDYRLESASR